MDAQVAKSAAAAAGATECIEVPMGKTERKKAKKKAERDKIRAIDDAIAEAIGQAQREEALLGEKVQEGENMAKLKETGLQGNGSHQDHREGGQGLGEEEGEGLSDDTDWAHVAAMREQWAQHKWEEKDRARMWWAWLGLARHVQGARRHAAQRKRWQTVLFAIWRAALRGQDMAAELKVPRSALRPSAGVRGQP